MLAKEREMWVGEMGQDNTFFNRIILLKNTPTSQAQVGNTFHSGWIGAAFGGDEIDAGDDP